MGKALKWYFDPLNIFGVVDERVTYNLAVAKLGKMQRLACFNIAETMKTTSTAATPIDETFVEKHE